MTPRWGQNFSDCFRNITTVYPAHITLVASNRRQVPSSASCGKTSTAGQPTIRSVRIYSSMRSMKRSGKTAKRASSLRSLAFPLICALLVGSAAPQETTLRSSSNVVLVPALVKDPHGGIVYGLPVQDFIVEDDGVQQPVRLDEAPEGQPISLVVAIQRGRRASYEFPRMQGLKGMLDPLFAAGTAQVAVVEFDKQIELTCDFTGRENVIDDALKNLGPGDNGASILDAIRYSVNLLKKQPEERLRILLLISEERDHGSMAKLDEAIAAVGQSNAVMYALAFSPGISNILDTERGNNSDTEMHEGVDFLDLFYRTAQAMRKNIPQTVAGMTGGEYELFTTRKKFEARMNDFTNHLHSRYLLSFTPKNPHRGLHQIRVRLRNSETGSVLARTTYWVGAPD
jgi:VWFA-related protein